MWNRNNIDISDASLCNWSLQCSKLLEALILLMKKDMLKGNYICSDETGLNVLLSKIAKNYMWVHHSGNRNKRAVMTAAVAVQQTSSLALKAFTNATDIQVIMIYIKKEQY
jgi:hypothetical protein